MGRKRVPSQFERGHHINGRFGTTRAKKNIGPFRFIESLTSPCFLPFVIVENFWVVEKTQKKTMYSSKYEQSAGWAFFGEANVKCPIKQNDLFIEINIFSF